MAKQVAVTPAQVKAAQTRLARMREQGEEPPAKLVKIAEATTREVDDEHKAAYLSFADAVIEARRKMERSEPGLFPVPEDNWQTVALGVRKHPTAAVGEERFVPYEGVNPHIRILLYSVGSSDDLLAKVQDSEPFIVKEQDLDF